MGYSKSFNFEFISVSYFLDDFKNLLSVFFAFTPNSAFLSDLATLEGVLIGVTIPISLQVVIWTADRYKDHEIAQFFVKETLYRLQYVLLLPNIIFAIFLRFLDISHLGILWVIFFWLIGNIIVFYMFIRLVEQYATNTDKILLKKLRGYVEDIFEK